MTNNAKHDTCGKLKHDLKFIKKQNKIHNMASKSQAKRELDLRIEIESLKDQLRESQEKFDSLVSRLKDSEIKYEAEAEQRRRDALPDIERTAEDMGVKLK